METLETIMTRRSVGKVKPDLPPKELIETVLGAATQAPNHHNTEPWRFFVLAGRAREDLGRVMAEVLRPQLPDPDSESGKALLAKEAEKPLRAPVLIVVASKASDNPKVVPIEEVEATAAAVENLLLAAHDLGLAAVWRTGKPAYDPRVKQLFDLGAADHLVGFIYLGYPDATPAPRQRSAAGKVEWRGWE